MMGQLFAVVCATTLFGLLLVPVHQISLNRVETLLGTEASSTATALGQEMIEQIITRKFDEKKCGAGEFTQVATDFSTTLGPDSGEVTTNLNTLDDVDDFNGYRAVVLTPRLGNFVDTCKVYYVT